MPYDIRKITLEYRIYVRRFTPGVGFAPDGTPQIYSNRLYLWTIVRRLARFSPK